MDVKSKKIRLDVYLVENGIFESREKARIAIMEGKIFVNNQKEDKPGTMIKSDAEVVFKGEKLKYVSRGGLKLEKAITVFNIDLKDKICVDIGSSTGGFTDCMLQCGAKNVFAIDCGTNQLDYSLRIDKRVICMENTNARYLEVNDLCNISKELNIDCGESLNIDFVATDVSFISLTKIIPVIKKLLESNRQNNHSETAVLLIKPQFEAGKDLVEKNGVIHDKKVHIMVIEKILDFCKEEGFRILGLDYSPIKGPAGNIEYLLYIGLMHDERDKKIEDKEKLIIENIKKVVEDSHIDESISDNKKK